MTEKKSPQNWQRLQLADFGKSPDKPRPALTVANKQQNSAAASEPDQTQGFLRGYDDGLVAGRFEGFAAGEAAGSAEGRQAANQLLSIAANLDHALTEVNREIADEILALALEISRQMLRQAIAVKPDVVLSVIRDALTHLPHHHAAIYLNPEDAALVRRYAGDQFAHAGHHIHEDPRLKRNDVIIEANGAQVDATIETRWRRVVDSLGGDTNWIDTGK